MRIFPVFAQDGHLVSLHSSEEAAWEALAKYCRVFDGVQYTGNADIDPYFVGERVTLDLVQLGPDEVEVG